MITKRIIPPLVLSILCIIILLFFPLNQLFTTNPYYAGDVQEHYISTDTAHLSTFLGEYSITKGLGEYLFFDQPTFFFLIIKIISYIIPLAIIFKVSIIIAICAFPLLSYWMWRKHNYSEYESISMTLILFFLTLHTAHGVYGGNILSLLYGEISYFYGFLLILVYVATIKTTNIHMQALLLSLAILIHPITGLSLILSHFIFSLATYDPKFTFKKYVHKSVVQGSIILSTTLWWIIAFLLYGNAVSSKTDQVTAYLALLTNTSATYLIAIVAITMIVSILTTLLCIRLNKRKILSLILFPIILLIVTLFFRITEIIGWAIRFEPIIYLGFSITVLTSITTYIMRKYLTRKVNVAERIAIGVCIVLLLSIIFILFITPQYNSIQTSFADSYKGDVPTQHITQIQELINIILKNTNQEHTRIYIDNDAKIYFIHNEQIRIINVQKQKNIIDNVILYIPVAINYPNSSDINLEDYAEFLSIEYFIIPTENVGVFENLNMNIIGNTTDFTLIKTNSSQTEVIPLQNATDIKIDQLKYAVPERIEYWNKHIDTNCSTTMNYTQYATYYFTTTCPNIRHVIKIPYHPFWKYKSTQQSQPVVIENYDPGFIAVIPNQTEFLLTYKTPVYLKLLYLLASIVTTGIMWNQMRALVKRKKNNR